MKGDFVDIREAENNDAVVTKGTSDSFSHCFLAREKREKLETCSFLHIALISICLLQKESVE